MLLLNLYTLNCSLPRSVNKFTKICKTSEQLEKILRQLEVQGEVVNNQVMLVQLVSSKFPFEVVVKLEESKLPKVENGGFEKSNLKVHQGTRKCIHYAYNTKGQVQVQGDNNKDYNNTYQRSVYHPTNKGKGYQFQT